LIFRPSFGSVEHWQEGNSNHMKNFKKSATVFSQKKIKFMDKRRRLNKFNTFVSVNDGNKLFKKIDFEGQ